MHPCTKAFPLLAMLTLLALPVPHASTDAGVQKIMLSNVIPHTDPAGNIIDAHDGSIALIDGPRGKEFFWYAMGYGYNLKTGKNDCPESGHWCLNCGRHFNNTIGVWTSPDLSPGSWVHRAEAIGSDWPSAMYYRSHALFNAKTKRESCCGTKASCSQH
jgi:hypothetical protein